MFGKSEIGIEELINELEKGQRIFKSFEKGLEVAKSIRALKQTENEVNARIATAKTEAEKAEKENVASMSRHEDMLSKAQKDIVVARNQAEKILSDAATEADKKIAQAQDASAQAFAIAVEKVNVLQAKAVDLEKKVNDLADEEAERIASLADIEGKLAKAKEAVKKALGE